MLGGCLSTLTFDIFLNIISIGGHGALRASFTYILLYPLGFLIHL